VRTGVTVSAVARKPEGSWSIAIENEAEALPADAVILACEGYRAAELLSESAPLVARELLGIAHPPVYVVALGYGPEARARIPEGFGVLIPRGAGYRALGVTWDGHLFPGRGKGDHLLVRVLFGGTFDPEVDRVGPSEIVDTAVREAASLLNLDLPPRFSRARLWPRAIPQYELGHEARRRRIETELGSLPGLFLAGNSLYGTAFGKAAARGVACGEQAAESLLADRIE
jgi:oxygen-dependent protoporphyrinogen oxidase